MPKLRLAFITDIHNGNDSGARLGTKAPRLLAKFAKAVGLYKPDAVIEGGDRVTAGNKEDSIRHMRHVKDVFNNLAAPKFHVHGNHDEKYLTAAENAEIMESPEDSYSTDLNGYHLVFLNTSVVRDPQGGLRAEPEKIEWLKNDLAATKLPTIVFSHVPLSNEKEDDDRISALRKGRPGNPFYYPEGPQIRDIMEKSGKVILCLNGHTHENRYRNINGIHYFTQQSLVETWKDKYRVPTGTFSFIELDDDKITVKLRGRETMRLDGRLRKTFSLEPRPLA